MWNHERTSAFAATWSGCEACKINARAACQTRRCFLPLRPLSRKAWHLTTASSCALQPFRSENFPDHVHSQGYDSLALVLGGCRPVGKREVKSNWAVNKIHSVDLASICFGISLHHKLLEFPSQFLLKLRWHAGTLCSIGKKVCAMISPPPFPPLA